MNLIPSKNEMTHSLYSWTRLKAEDCHLIQPLHYKEIFKEASFDVIHGAGRSYSDIALPLDHGKVLCTSNMNRVVYWDRDRGEMEVESGITLEEVNRLALTEGWGLMIMPGTAKATVGGCLANDVHGKNHEKRGSFSRSVKTFKLWRRETGVEEVTRANESRWKATVGGLGATGLIVTVTLQLMPWQGPWMMTEQERFESLEEFLEKTKEQKHEYSVGWVDSFKEPIRGVLFKGSHTSVQKPVHESGWLESLKGYPLPSLKVINAEVSQVFNQVYWWAHPNRTQRLSDWRSFFCPLDQIKAWNRLYGKNGFVQFQGVIPEHQAIEAYKAMFKVCRQHHQGSFLSVIKRLGSMESEGYLSFAREGITFAMDFPCQEGTDRLMETLKAMTLEAGGALYPAKIKSWNVDEFDQSFPNWEQWKKEWAVDGDRSAWMQRLNLNRK